MSSPRSVPTVDRVSALPDTLICHILSFLPTKLAVATSILSKRWTPLWKSVLTLDFDDEGFTDFGRFRHFVYSVILSRHITLPLRSFRINCGKSENFDLCDVNRFVHTAVQRGLQNLDLDLSNLRLFNHMEYYLTPSVHCVFNCKTLVVLKLASLEIDDVPQSVDLPLLKTLHLNYVSFPFATVHSEMFVHGCPNLENLVTNIDDYPYSPADSEGGDIKGFPKLVRANLSYYIDIFPFDWLYNATFLRAELMHAYEYRIPTFHNLTDMELIFHSDSWEGKWKWLIQVLQHCPKLQNLTIEEAIEYEDLIEDEDWKDPKTIPECLLYRLRTCCLRCFNGYQCELQFAEYIMMNSKLLYTMTIKSRNQIDEKEKHQMLVKLSSYPRGSTTCKLLFH